MSPADPLLDGLNPSQRAAVTSDPTCCTLVLAGAGSGKTRALAHRFAWLAQTQGIPPREIMAVTFTNKAATEMRERIERMLGGAPPLPWIGTFHALCRRMLLRFPTEAGLPENFQILDRDDQKTLVRQVLRDMDRPRKQRDVANAIRWISLHKRNGQRARHIEPLSHNEELYIKVMERYENRCQSSGMVDFDELLLRCVELLRDHDAVRQHYQQRLRHFLADEFQDVDELQYAWLCLLAGDERPLFVVGDDDQSIYGWRGAQPDHMLNFEQKHPGTKTWALEQNYRSTTTILNTANALIEHNANRLPKKLWSKLPDSGSVRMLELPSGDAEAAWVTRKVRGWVEDGGRWCECAVLYRTNRQSQAFETQLARQDIPYRIYGGLRFFERREVKDALAYLRLCLNPNDDVSWLRVCNEPPRGIGDTTVEKVRDEANASGMALAEAARTVARKKPEARAARALAAFGDCLTALRRKTAECGLAEAIRRILEDSGLGEMYRTSDEDLEEMRSENLEELVNAAAAFEEHFDPEMYGKASAAEAFLDSATLEAGERGEGRGGHDAVQLMTLHMAKGLEFPLVVIAGMEDGTLPLGRDDSPMEEERRLCYVGITRAQRELALTYALSRRTYGKFFSGLMPSRFLQELAHAGVAIEADGGAALAGPQRSTPAVAAGQPNPRGYPPPGAAVSHPTFGAGTIEEYEGRPPQLRVKVNFEEAGSKFLVYDVARLTLL